MKHSVSRVITTFRQKVTFVCMNQDKYSIKLEIAVKPKNLKGLQKLSIPSIIKGFYIHVVEIAREYIYLYKCIMYSIDY